MYEGSIVFCFIFSFFPGRYVNFGHLDHGILINNNKSFQLVGGEN